MPRPAGLQFDDRLAPWRNGHIFLCQRHGHRPLQRFIPGAEKDAEQARAAHDAVYHNAAMHQIGVRPDANIGIVDLTAEWASHIARLVERGKRSRKTERHYEYMAELLKKVFKARESLTNLAPSRISRAAADLADEIDGDGATVVKALSALRTMLAWRGYEQHWKMPLSEIDPQPADKRDLTMEQILWLLEHCPAGSVEEAVIALKMRTGMREVEITSANVEDFDPRERLIEPALRSKSPKARPRRQVYALSEDVVDLLIPFAIGRARSAPLLHIDGMRLKESSLRRRLVAASKRANEKLIEGFAKGELSREECERKLIDPPLRGLKPIRAEVVTLIADELTIEDASKFVGHKDTATTERWYYKNRITAAKLEQKRRIADVLQRLSPLPERGRVHDAEHERRP